MAVKASANITLFDMVDIDGVTNYYLLQSSTANPPAKPTTDNPGGNWSTTEPTYTEGSTNTLYTVMKTKFSDGTFEYTPVSKSSSYEAAKSAYNKASNAQTTANTANDKIDNLQSKHDYVVGTQTAATRFWTGVSNLTSLKDGQEIMFWLPYATAYTNAGDRTVGVNMRVNSSTTKTAGTTIISFETGTSTNVVWLNLTLKGGNSTGWVPCYYGGTQRLTSHYGAGNAIRLVYRVNAKVDGEAATAQYTGWFADANYVDGNNTDRLRFQNNIKTDQQYVPSGHLIAQKDNGCYSLIKRGASFKIDSPILFTGSNISPLSKNNNTYLMYSGITIASVLSYYCEIGDVSVSNSNVGYSGNKITGTSTTPTVFSGSGITTSNINDVYINTTSQFYFYKCTLAGNASTAKWTYVKNLYTSAGKRWYNGNKITGTSTTPTVFSGSGISSAAVGDYYFNSSTGYYYECTLAGNASTAKWKYDGILIKENKTIYLRGRLDDNIFEVDDISLTTEIPTIDDGLYYISLGITYGYNAFGLFPEHPMYKFVNGEFKPLSQVAYEAQSLAISNDNAINGENGLNNRLDIEIADRSLLSKITESLNNTILGSNTVTSDTAPQDTTKYWLDTLTHDFKRYDTSSNTWVNVLPNDILTTVTKSAADILQLQNKVVLEFDDEITKSAFDAEWQQVIEQTSKFNKRFEFNSSGLTISSSEDTTYKLVLTNQSISIQSQGTDMSWWDPDGFNSKHVTCEGLSYKLPDESWSFKWVYNTNNSISFRKESN